MSLREADSAGFFVQAGLWDDRLDFPSSPRSAVCVEFIYLERRVQESLFALLIVRSRTISQ